MSNHKITASCPFANSDDGMEVEIVFSFTPGAGPTGPTYASGGEPGYPAQVELVSVKPTDAALILPIALQNALDEWANLYLAGNDGYYWACEAAADDNEAAREYAAELRATPSTEEQPERSEDAP